MHLIILIMPLLEDQEVEELVVMVVQAMVDQELLIKVLLVEIGLLLKLMVELAVEVLVKSEKILMVDRVEKLVMVEMDYLHQ